MCIVNTPDVHRGGYRREVRMAANARNLERGEEKRSIVADESALLALAAEKRVCCRRHWGMDTAGEEYCEA